MGLGETGRRGGRWGGRGRGRMIGIGTMRGMRRGCRGWRRRLGEEVGGGEEGGEDEAVEGEGGGSARTYCVLGCTFGCWSSQEGTTRGKGGSFAARVGSLVFSTAASRTFSCSYCFPFSPSLGRNEGETAPYWSCPAGIVGVDRGRVGTALFPSLTSKGSPFSQRRPQDHRQ